MATHWNAVPGLRRKCSGAQKHQCPHQNGHCWAAMMQLQLAYKYILGQSYMHSCGSAAGLHYFPHTLVGGKRAHRTLPKNPKHARPIGLFLHFLALWTSAQIDIPDVCNPKKSLEALHGREHSRNGCDS